MSGKLRTVFSIVCLLALACGVIQTAAAEEAGPSLRWFGHSLQVARVSLNPPHITADTPQNTVFCMVHFYSTEDSIPIRDIVEQLSLFSLLDAQGNAYAATAYMPCSIVYNERNAVFMTATSQTEFDIFFRIPPDTDPMTLVLRSDEGECWLADLGAANITIHE